jgi:hypothetical protein
MLAGERKTLMNLILSPLRAVGLAIGFVFRLNLALMLVLIIALVGFVLVKGSQPMGEVGADPNGESTVLSDVNYWEFMSGRLAASSETPTNCHRTRLIYLTIALPVYPAVYTYIALYPESSLARQAQPSPLIPDPISWQEAPETWWRLVKEISWLAFTEPQWDYTPAVGQRVNIDSSCTLPLVR